MEMEAPFDGLLVEVDVDKITILPPPPSLPTLPPYFVSYLPTILYLTQVTVI